MMPGVTALVPMAFVANVPRSTAFYGALGFVVKNTFTPPGAGEPSWAFLESAGARFMVARATEPVMASQQAVLFYVYCDDVVVMRAQLQEAGLSAGPIEHPFYAPRGEFRIEDPDGYVLMVMNT